MKETKTAVVTAHEGLTMNCVTANHEFEIKGAPTMGGDGRGMDPVEVLLASVGACELVIAKSFAPLRGIQLDSIAVEVKGHFEDYGFEFLKQENKTSKVGFAEIHSTYTIDSPNSAQEIEEFIAFVESNCPVIETMENAPKFSTKVIKVGA